MMFFTAAAYFSLQGAKEEANFWIWYDRRWSCNFCFERSGLIEKEFMNGRNIEYNGIVEILTARRWTRVVTLDFKLLWACSFSRCRRLWNDRSSTAIKMQWASPWTSSSLTQRNLASGWDRNYLTLDCKTLGAIVEVTLRTWSCLEEQQRLRQEE